MPRHGGMAGLGHLRPKRKKHPRGASRKVAALLGIQKGDPTRMILASRSKFQQFRHPKIPGGAGFKVEPKKYQSSDSWRFPETETAAHMLQRLRRKSLDVYKGRPIIRRRKRGPVW